MNGGSQVWPPSGKISMTFFIRKRKLQNNMQNTMSSMNTYTRMLAPAVWAMTSERKMGVHVLG